MSEMQTGDEGVLGESLSAAF